VVKVGAGPRGSLRMLDHYWKPDLRNSCNVIKYSEELRDFVVREFPSPAKRNDFLRREERLRILEKAILSLRHAGRKAGRKP
jgi:hypothetical protein